MLTRIVLCLWFLPAAAMALYAEAPLSDNRQEAEAQRLFKEVRCVVCEGQTIADSNAALARDMRHLIRSSIASDTSAEDIKNMLVERYGPDVLLTTPVAASTYILWALPLILLMFGLAIIFQRQRR